MSDKISVPLSPAQAFWNLFKDQATRLAFTPFLNEELRMRALPDNAPEEMKKRVLYEAVSKISSIMQMGHELGIAPMQAISAIHVIKGKPSLSASLMLALCYKKIPGFRAVFKEKHNVECVGTFYREGCEPQSFTFTLEDAKRAGLNGTGWQKYPAAMLRARVTATGCRAVAPDAIIGWYATEELGDEVIDVVASEGVGSPPEARKDSPPEIPNNTVPSTPPRPATGNTPGYDARHEKRMSEPSTVPQHKKFFAMTNQLGMSDLDRKEFVCEHFGYDTIEELTKTEIQQAFQILDKWLNDKPSDPFPFEKEAK